jgi:hypothetical protein
MSSAAGQLEASLAHADMLSASENAPAKRARVAVDARGDSGESQWADRRGGQSAGSAACPRGYGMPEGHSSSHFANERKMSLQTQKTQLEVLAKELSWVSSITIAGTKVINFQARPVAASLLPSSTARLCMLMIVVGAEAAYAACIKPHLRIINSANAKCRWHALMWCYMCRVCVYSGPWQYVFHFDANISENVSALGSDDPGVCARPPASCCSTYPHAHALFSACAACSAYGGVR